MKTLALIVLSGMAATAANAQLLFAPSITDIVLTPNSGNIDDTTYAPAFTLTGFTLFGAAVTPANFRVNNNGWMAFQGAGNANGGNSWINAAIPFSSSTAGTAMIAPFFDDLFISGASTALAGKSLRISSPDAGTMVITFQGYESFLNTSPDLNFQAILYGVGNSVGAIPGTITFAYASMLVGTAAFTPSVGLNAGNGIGNAVIPGIGGAIGNNLTAGLLAATQHSFIPNGNDGYRYQAGSIPTPAAAALLGLGGLMAARRRRA